MIGPRIQVQPGTNTKTQGLNQAQRLTGPILSLGLAISWATLRFCAPMINQPVLKLMFNDKVHLK